MDNPIAGLLQALEEDQDESRRCAAAIELGQFRDPKVVRSLYSCLLREKAKAVQEAILLSLCSIGLPEVVDVGCEMLKNENACIRRMGVEILSCLGNEAIPALGQLLKDPDPDTRLMVLSALAEANSPDVAPLLRDVIRNDGDVNVVAAAVECLAGLGQLSEQDSQIIKEAALRFNEPFLKYTVERALGYAPAR